MQPAQSSPQIPIEKKRAILRERALRLAKVEEKESACVPTLNLIAFELGKEKYAIEVRYVKEVCPFKNYTPLPGAPPFVIGLINVRRKVFSVVDLKKIFNIPSGDRNGEAKVIILSFNDMEFGLFADSVVGNMLLPFESLQTTLSTFTGVRKEYLKGITKDHLIVLDGEKLLKSSSLVVGGEKTLEPKL